MARGRSPLMRRLGQLFANLGGTFGSLYGAGNGGGLTHTPGPTAPPPRRAAARRKHKRKKSS